MGRTRTKSKKAALISEVAAPQQKTDNGPSIPALLEKTQSLITQCDYELASKFAGRILEKDVANASAREMLGICQLELGELYAAKETFQSLIPPHPLAPTPPPPLAYQYLAQLSIDDAWQALKLYEASIELLHSQLKGKDRATATQEENGADDEERETRSSIVKALVGMVEIWMDPQHELCDLPEAEQTCQDLLEKAKQVDPENVEALQMLASVRMSQSRPDEARQCLETAWAQWKDLEIDDARMPTQETRLQFVKLCLELSLFSPALVALQGFMANDDQDVEAWYLEGWCFFLMTEQARENGAKVEELSWEELARDARDCLETCSVLHSNQDHPDQPMLAHVQELISQLDTLGIRPSPLDEEEDEQEGWEDASDEDDVDMT